MTPKESCLEDTVRAGSFCGSELEYLIIIIRQVIQNLARIYTKDKNLLWLPYLKVCVD